jgi:tRNA1Val (adenine37-N6)-methyltransferase
MSYFQFKQFTIQQARCALKVCTDACLFGAWTASRLKDEKEILDIGSGSGLLMLMMAQNSPAWIDGIEIDVPSKEQSEENLEASSWNERLNVFQGDVRYFEFEKKYDLIISNPPFFENDLASKSKEEQVAKHSSSLKLEQLMAVMNARVNTDGSISLLLPYHRLGELHKLTQYWGFWLEAGMSVRQTPKHSAFRWMGIYSRIQTPNPLIEELIIQDEKGVYTSRFSQYLSPYYLKL